MIAIWIILGFFIVLITVFTIFLIRGIKKYKGNQNE